VTRGLGTLTIDEVMEMGNKSKQHSDQPHREKDSWLPHRDWRVYLGVALMLIAMFVYLATLDESVKLDGTVNSPVPAAPSP
jgi:hypothetical protein